MKVSPAISSRSPRGRFNLGLQPAPAWTAILGLVLFSALCIVAGAGSLLRLAFPAGSLAVGIFLYFRYPILYIGFTWWMWFLSPFVRRLADFRGGFIEPNTILLAPYLVTLITIVTLGQHLPRTYRQGGLPFVLAFIGVFYGFLVGGILNSPMVAVRALLDWLTPVLFGFHLFANWRIYPNYRENIQRVFVWCALITGVYGVIQYLVAPEWDRYWLINTEMISAGTPEPMGMRVWSTMNGPGVFASVMMAGLLLLFGVKGALRLPASAAGYLAFLLSLVRSAWVGWIVGLLALGASLKPKLQMRFFITVLLIALCVVPLTAIEPFSEVINSRVQTLSNVQEDGSGEVRRQIYMDYLSKGASNLLGEGIGNKTSGEEAIDSAILNMLFSLGWFGIIFYVGGMILILFELFLSSESSFDQFAGSSRAIAIAMFVQLLFGSAMLGLPGVVFWGFMGIGMAARKYYQHQSLAARYQDFIQKT